MDENKQIPNQPQQTPWVENEITNVQDLDPINAEAMSVSSDTMAFTPFAEQNEAVQDDFSDPEPEFNMDIFATLGLDEDFSVMVMQISDDLTVVSVDFPTRDFAPGCAQRAYLAWNKADNAGRYFTTDLTREKTIELIEIGADHSRISHGEAPVEGAELQTIIDLISDGEKLN